MYNPFTKELYQAVKDGGAFLNGRVLEASRTTVMEEAMVVSGKWKGGVVARRARVFGSAPSGFVFEAVETIDNRIIAPEVTLQGNG